MIADEAAARAFVSARCDMDALVKLNRLVVLLAEENARQNLVSSPSLQSMWQRHIADSAQLLDHWQGEGSTDWLDLGSGAGFPGLVIAIMRPQVVVTLIESRRLRIEWLQRVCDDLGLTNCQVKGSRVELMEDRKVGVISARAFAPLPKLIKLASRFSTSDTTWLLPKGRSAAQEVAELPGRLRTMFHVEPSQTDPEAGIVIGRIAEGPAS